VHAGHGRASMEGGMRGEYCAIEIDAAHEHPLPGVCVELTWTLSCLRSTPAHPGARVDMATMGERFPRNLMGLMNLVLLGYVPGQPVMCVCAQLHGRLGPSDFYPWLCCVCQWVIRRTITSPRVAVGNEFVAIMTGHDRQRRRFTYRAGSVDRG